jgi:hypothetical protein
MTAAGRGAKLILIGAIVLGLLGLVGPAASSAEFTDSQVATGSATAVDDFGGGGPRANAGGPYTVDEGETVILDGSDSSTSQGNIRDYSWQILDGPGSLSGAGTVDPTYNAPSNVDSDTAVSIELTVTDNKGNSDTDTATITVSDTGTADTPAVDSLSVTTTGNKNQELEITANVSDPTSDGDELQNVTIEVVRTKNSKVDYSTTIAVSGDNATISDVTEQLKNKKEYRVEVTVYDTDGDSGSANQTQTTE